MSTPWGAIFKAIQQKRDGIRNSFAQGAQAMGAFANNGNAGFTPTSSQLPPAQTQGLAGIFNKDKHEMPQENERQVILDRNLPQNNNLEELTFKNPYRYL